MAWSAGMLCGTPCLAQELSPQAYWPAPRGTRVVAVGYAYSWGDVITDPTLPLTGVDSRLHTMQVGYLHTLSLLGRTSGLLLEVPYTAGTTSGELAGEQRTRDLSGLGDVGLTLSLNLFGAPSMTPQEFRELSSHPHQILATSVKVVAPVGEYDPARLINLGTNRWAVKSELGYMLPLGPKWIVESEAGIWFFEDNEEFMGATREQSPILAGELHLVRRLRPGRWVSLELNLYGGGQTTVNGVRKADLQRNSRLGSTLSWMLVGRQSLKVAVSMGIVAESSTDYYTVLVGYNIPF